MDPPQTGKGHFSMWVAKNGSAQRAMGSPGSCASAKTPPWPRELLSAWGC